MLFKLTHNGKMLRHVSLCVPDAKLNMPNIFWSSDIQSQLNLHKLAELRGTNHVTCCPQTHHLQNRMEIYVYTNRLYDPFVLIEIPSPVRLAQFRAARSVMQQKAVTNDGYMWYNVTERI